MQAEIMSLRSGQWLQVIREQAQSGQTAEQWCRVHRTARSTYYRWKKALREALLAQMETESEGGTLAVTTTSPENEPQFATLVVLEAARNKAHATNPGHADKAAIIQIRIRETDIEVLERVEAGHLEMVLKAVQNARTIL